jgi:hypothetical protein
MAYTIYYNFGGNVANSFSVADGNLNTSNTSLALPGRNFAGYGSPIDQNLVDITQNFARNTSGPNNSILGQFWYDSSNSAMKFNTSSNSTPNWAVVAISSTVSNVDFNTVDAGNVSITGSLVADTINAGGTVTPGTITGNWSVATGSTLRATTVTVNAQPNITSVGTLTSLAVTGNVTGANITGNIATTTITAGANSTAGTITGNWTLSAGSRLNATYADLAERFEADTEYDYGTVLELGGDKEVTSAKEELSENVFGVISDTAGYLMNAMAGDDRTHPPVAMTGRVQVKVIGQVKKGDRLVSAGNGVARAAKTGEANSFNTIGRALEDKTTKTVERVLAAVSAKL